MRTSLKSFHEFLDVILPQVFGQIHLGRDQIYEITTSHHELTVQPRYLSRGVSEVVSAVDLRSVVLFFGDLGNFPQLWEMAHLQMMYMFIMIYHDDVLELLKLPEG